MRRIHMWNPRNLFRTAGATLLFLVTASLLTYNRSDAAGTTKSTTPDRGYYLTTGTYDGSHALAACTTRYHMASLWEIHETSNLRYDTTLGFTAGDSGSGPPTTFTGWIRTGFDANNGNTDSGNAPGISNCNAWASNLATDYGTAAAPFLLWNNPNAVYSVSPWSAQTGSCSDAAHVWCVQD
jgi:hypothetical protein